MRSDDLFPPDDGWPPPERAEAPAGRVSTRAPTPVPAAPAVPAVPVVPAPGAAPAVPAPAERKLYTVTRLNREARLALERGMGVVWVEGELSNLSQPGSGHWYFSLKDRESQLRCAMFRTRNTGVGFTPKSGQQVIARGRVTLYEARGDYQLIVEHLEEAGVGALKREFERLKTKLDAEGLFALERKRPLPAFPRRVGVVTSPTGAAVRDVLHVLARRFPPAEVLVYPTAVQGAAAVPQILAALNLAATRAECDVLILARGGGSLEDLWAFNDERVARAIVASPLPIVTGIGHEVDFTIADFVADARAPTPSAAAERVVPDRNACLDVLARTAERLNVAMRRELRAISSRLDAAAQRLNREHPGSRLAQQAQRLDDLEQRLATAVRAGLQDDRHRVSEALVRLIRHSPERRVREHCLKYEALAARLQNAARERLSKAEHRLSLAARTLNTVSPLATLDRGFAIVTRAADGALVTDVGSVSVGDEIDARVAKGRLRARITSKE